jgi:hypothetical protein
LTGFVYPTLTSSRPSTSYIPLPALKATLQEAVAARGNTYRTITALVFYWEDDNTGAKSDIDRLEKTFQHAFGVKAIRVELKKNDPMPGYTVTNKFDKMVRHSHNPNRQSLILLGYVGHASMDKIHGLRLTSSTGKKIAWDFLSTRTLHLPSDPECVDVFVFLDCCYAGAASRSDPTRSIQILAACGPKEVARSRAASITFTQRFCGEVERAQKFHRGKVSIPELFQRFQETKNPGTPNPQLSTLSGLAPIVIPLMKLPGPGSPRPSQVPARTTLPDPDEQHVLVQLTLAGPAKEVTAEFRRFVETLPVPFKLSIVDAFQTTKSALILVRMNWETWARIDAALDLEPVMGVIIGRSLIHEDALSEVPLVGENIPLHQKGI